MPKKINFTVMMRCWLRLLLITIWAQSFAASVFTKIDDDTSPEIIFKLYDNTLNGNSFAHEQLKALADQGNHLAESYMCLQVRKDFSKPLTTHEQGQLYAGRCLEWLQAQVLLENPFAQTNLGIMYEHGIGVSLNFTEAARLMTLAANQNFSMAQYHLSWLYEYGFGVEQDLHQAKELCTKAADQEFSTAQNHLGCMYKYGSHIKQKCVDGKFGVTIEHKTCVIEKNHNEAMRLFLSAAQQGHACAQFHVATLYERNRSGAPNYIEAVSWYTRAGQQKHPAALYNLGVLHEEGKGVTQSLREAAQQYEKSAELGFARAQQKYGTMLIQGIGVPVDKNEGNRWLKKALEQK